MSTGIRSGSMPAGPSGEDPDFGAISAARGNLRRAGPPIPQDRLSDQGKAPMTNSANPTQPTRPTPRFEQPRRRASAVLPCQSPSGVAVVGAGNVGAAVANALVLMETTDLVVLYDRQLSRAEGESWDIADGTPLLRNVEVVATDDWMELRRAQVVVVTVGALMQPGHSRLEEHNGDLITAVIERLDAVAPRAVVLIVSNPVDVMTRLERTPPLARGT